MSRMTVSQGGLGNITAPKEAIHAIDMGFTRSATLYFAVSAIVERPV
jgi:hypothetical protein